jgi:hypothetical protein
MKKNFIKIATQAAATGAGAVAAGFAASKLTFIPKNLHGVVFTALGIVGESYVKGETAKSAMRGLSTYGMIRLAEDTILKNPDLAGIGYVEEGVRDNDTQYLGEIDLGEIDLGEIDLGQLDNNAFSDINGVDALDDLGYIEELDGVDDEFDGVDDEFGEVELDGVDDDDDLGDVDFDIM